MTSTSDSAPLEQLRRYFLRQLNDADTRAIQERILSDDEFDDVAELVAEELCLDYAAGRLSAAERKVVDSLAQIPEWRDRLLLARATTAQAQLGSGAKLRSNGAATKGRGSGRPAFRFNVTRNPVALAASVVAVLTTGLWLRETSRINALDSGSAALRRQLDSAAAIQDALQRSVDAQRTTEIFLPPGANRSSLSSRAIGGDIAFVRLRLALPTGIDGSPGLLVVRVVPDGQDAVFSRVLADSAIDRSTRTLAVSVPATLLREGSYTIELLRRLPQGGEELVESYPLALTR